MTRHSETETSKGGLARLSNIFNRVKDSGIVQDLIGGGAPAIAIPATLAVAAALHGAWAGAVLGGFGALIFAPITYCAFRDFQSDRATRREFGMKP
jgi:hypothetical protein